VLGFADLAMHLLDDRLETRAQLLSCVWLWQARQDLLLDQFAGRRLLAGRDQPVKHPVTAKVGGRIEKARDVGWNHVWQ
jgi:hypothetical protein